MPGDRFETNENDLAVNENNQTKQQQIMKTKISRFPALSLAVAAMLAILNFQFFLPKARLSPTRADSRAVRTPPTEFTICGLRFMIRPTATSILVAGPVTISGTGVAGGESIFRLKQ